MSVVSSVLIPIIKLWLRSQVEHIDTLEIEIAGKSRQILSGDIPKANVIGAGARYQGLAVTNIDLCAEAIHLNITQILKGDALRLLDPIRVTIDVELSPEDLQSCLKSPIFIDAITPDAPLIATTDDEIRALLEQLVHKLGDEFTLHELAIADGGAKCRGEFAITAT
ncbi:MAG: DUF2993 domain-containing protein [Pseudanabaena sp.]|jgi:hypothetical protein|uniref:LmeA family phospholipid-binding protein n=1 Tax=Pseudanabaena mucicola TaxID=71190 RepID=UPI0025762192|nr:DUF2993 domain-containing protein [Pseudanabaena mucicola]MCA6573964.1 LmeA family phospholipid-binding protein [Pseudanabaena sp. M53BS1SP1A06MG]MCA6584769.1 LmeA family phospholipid-binding protein [Pseudanabaena sp. M34BS1SP1A06MG]MCA6585931.1 LmeA family phospholipid-binding protein [Pseudanabaena sp. M051S1SP1A06QC]MCA6588198.1 LmeA family phospholipid-binding protein [Pseudanabaena sp. M109S1SP1A06QC]MCA6594247.1 LmeA family phospholipid-binding protein [Pseudanabaena sp. M38BS1SP1A06